MKTRVHRNNHKWLGLTRKVHMVFRELIVLFVHKATVQVGDSINNNFILYYCIYM